MVKHIVCNKTERHKVLESARAEKFVGMKCLYIRLLHEYKSREREESEQFAGKAVRARQEDAARVMQLIDVHE